MKKAGKTIVFVVVLFLLAINPMGIQKHAMGENMSGDTELSPKNHGDQLDQEQTLDTSSGSVVCNDFWIAQSFKPILPVLTRVELRLFRMNGISSDFITCIRSNLTGEDLTSISLPYNKISTSSSWIEFDFPDIDVIPERSYYIICRTNGGDWAQKDMYKWSCSHLNPYSRGQLHCSIDGGLTWDSKPYSSYDQCFKTYGIDNLPPKTLCILSGTLGNGNWYISDVEVTLQATDTTGVDYTKYRIDGNKWETYASPFIVSMEGIHKIEYYSVDNIGNEEEMKSCNIKIDKTKPIVAINKPYAHLYLFDREILPMPCTIVIGKITVEIDARDSFSGIKKVELFIGGEHRKTFDSEPYRWLWDEKAFGNYNIRITAEDRASENHLVEKTVKIMIYNI